MSNDGNRSSGAAAADESPKSEARLLESVKVSTQHVSKNDNRSASYSPPLMDSCASPAGSISGHRRRDGSSSEKARKDREERIKLIRERQEQDHERRMAELRAAQERDDKIRQLKEAERERRIKELRMRENMHRQAVEERRRMLEMQDSEKRQQILAKYKEYEDKNAQANRAKKPVYAFGSSTPRLLSYLDNLENSQKVYNIRLHATGSPTAGDDSFSNASAAATGGGSSKRAVSSIHLNRRPLSAKRMGSVMTMSVHANGSSINQHSVQSDLLSSTTGTLLNAKSMTASYAAGDSPTISPFKNVRLKMNPPSSSRAQSTPRTSRSAVPARRTTDTENKAPLPSSNTPKRVVTNRPSTPVHSRNSTSDAQQTDAESKGSVISSNTTKRVTVPKPSKPPVQRKNSASDAHQVDSAAAGSNANLSTKPKFPVRAPSAPPAARKPIAVTPQPPKPIAVSPQSPKPIAVPQPPTTVIEVTTKVTTVTTTATTTATTTEEEAKSMLAERRRLAREQMEREKELEAIRLEQERLAEEERLRREEEEFRRQEEEELRALEEAKRLEEERLKLAMEERQRQLEEEQRIAEEEKKKQLEAEAAAREQAERAENERRKMEEKLRKEEEERLERKKKLEAIMQRTRQANGGGSANSNSTPKAPSNQNLLNINNPSGSVSPSNGLSHSVNFSSSEELNKTLSSGLLSSSSASVLQRLTNSKTDVGRSVENIMARVRSSPNTQKLDSSSSSVMTKSVMMTSDSDGKMAPTMNGNDHSSSDEYDSTKRMTMSLYDPKPSSLRMNGDLSSLVGEPTQYDVDVKSAASVSRLAEVVYNNGTASATTGTATTNRIGDTNANSLNNE